MVDWDAELKKLVKGKVPQTETHDPSELRLEVTERYTDEDIIGHVTAKIRLVLLNRKQKELSFGIGPVLNGIFIERGLDILTYLSFTLGCIVMFDAESHTLTVKFMEEQQ